MKGDALDPKTWGAFDLLQERYCNMINISAVVMDSLAVAYSLVGMGLADFSSPSAVQTWLCGAEVMALACGALNGILLALGLCLGGKVDTLGDDTSDTGPNGGATTLTVGDGSAVLQTGADKKAPSLSLIDATVAPASPFVRTPVKQITLAAAPPAPAP